MSADLDAAPSPALPSSLADLGDVPLGKLQEVAGGELSETLGRLLPAPEVAQVPVAAFNSHI